MDDEDYEDFDSRAAVGEQSFEEETAQAEEAGSEAEEIAFKLKVAAVVRVAAKANRFATVSNHRLRPAAGGGGVAAKLGMQVHSYAQLSWNTPRVLVILCTQRG